jgi:hypothetical protein
VKRRIVILACSGILGLGVLAATAAQAPGAHAQVTDVTCVGTDSSVISPGLLFTPQTVTITTTKIYALCVSTDLTLISGISVTTGTAVRSCDLTTFDHPGVAVISWNNGQTSTFTYNAMATFPAGESVVTFTGAITAGEFTGDTAVVVSTGAAIDPGACLAPPGVTSLSGTLTLEFVST